MLMLAVWYYDDGYNTASQRRAILCSDSFSVDEVEFLVDQIKLLGFGKCHRASKNRIEVYSTSYREFILEIEKTLSIPCLDYKVSLNGFKEMSRRPRTLTTEKQAAEIVRLGEETPLSQRDIGLYVGVSTTQVNVLLRRRNIKRLPSNCSSGFVGVTQFGNQWRARIGINGRRICLGLFDSKALAVEARSQAECNLKMVGHY
jgi:hypothetical protein